MTLGRRLEPAGIIDMIPSLPIHTSVLIPLVAGLFLAALILRAQRLPRRPLPQSGLTTRQARSARRRVQRSRRLRGVRTVTKGEEMKHNHKAPASFRIYWGRTIVALLGLLALIGGAATAVAVPLVTTLTWAVPTICAAVLLVSVVSLQVMAAVRRRKVRRRRVERAMQEALNSHPEAAADVVQRQCSAAAAAVQLGIESSPAQDEDAQVPFDALSAEPGSLGGPDSLISLDEDGLPTSAERLFAASDSAGRSKATDQSQTSRPAEPASAESWNIRDVPSAKYMVAEKAPRSEPNPLEPEHPAPVGEVKLKQQAGTAQNSELPADSTAPQESMNLDKVLRRRRA